MTPLTSNSPMTGKDKPLKGETIALLLASGFNEHEMTQAQRALAETGARIRIISTEQGLAQGWHDNVWGHYFAVEQPLSGALAADYSMLLVPGGQRSMDKLKSNPHTARFLKGFLSYGNPIALLGDAVQLLAHVNMAEGMSVTGPQSMQAMMTAAGAKWSDDAFVTSGAVLTGQADGDKMAALIEQVVAHFVSIPAELRMAA